MGILARKHMKNLGKRFDRRKRHQFARHLATNHARNTPDRGGPVVTHWPMSAADLARLATYNETHAARPDWWLGIQAMVRKAFGFAPLTASEAERAFDEAESVPLSEARIQEIVAYATGRGSKVDVMLEGL